METLIQIHVFSNIQAEALKNMIATDCIDNEEDWTSESFALEPAVFMWGSIKTNAQSFLEEITEYYKEKEFDVLSSYEEGELIIKIHPTFAKNRKLTLNEWFDLLDEGQISQLMWEKAIEQTPEGDYFWRNSENELPPSNKWEVTCSFLDIETGIQPLNKVFIVQTKSMSKAEVLKVALEQLSLEDAILLNCINITKTNGMQPNWLQECSLFFF